MARISRAQEYFCKRPLAGFLWHHVEDCVTMQLIPTKIHNAVRHTGGAAVIRNGGYDQ